MKSILLNSGVKKNVLLLVGVCVAASVLISILEEVVSMLAYYWS